MSKLIVTLISLFLLASGCGGNPPKTGLDRPGLVPTTYPTHHIGFSHMDTDAPGMAQGTVFALGTAIVFWSNVEGGTHENSWNSSEEAKGEGRLAFNDGRKIEFSYATKDGKTGRVTVEGVDYDLSKGNLFLVAGKGERFRVEQLRRNLDPLKLEPESLIAFGKTDAEITEFFGKEEKPKR